MLRRTVLVLPFLLAASGGAHAFDMSFTWGPTKPCFDPKSPPITLKSVPDGTKKLRFKMVDLDAPSYPHGGGTVSYAGKNSLPYGAFRYQGPCPPSPHTYQISVDALDGSGKKLGSAKAKRRFP
jgi:phosphatidylethanolamine-binding protein (PEBP) family uncharacterized protein